MNILGARSLAGLRGYEQLYPRLVPRPRMVQPTTAGSKIGWIRNVLEKSICFILIKPISKYLLSVSVQMSVVRRAVASTWSPAPPRWVR